jgi:hypothetical protein
MRSLLLQDWTTVRGSGTTAVVQSTPDWLDLRGYADAVFWIEIAEVTNPGAGRVTLSLETAPAPLETLFVAMDTIDALTASRTPKVHKVFLNCAAGAPLARFLRWKLAGSVSGTWDVTFRLHVTVGEGVRNAFSPLALPGLQLWLRADRGVTLSGTSVTQWNDLSGNGNHVSQSVSGNRPTVTANAFAITGRSALDFTGGKWLENTVSNLSMSTGGEAYSVMVVAKTGNGALLSVRRVAVYTASIFLQTGPNTYVFSDGANVAANVTVASTAASTQSGAGGFKSCHRYLGTGNNPDVYLNGVGPLAITSVGTHQTTENGTTGFQVGTDPAAQVWGGLIAEVIVMTGAITDSYRLRVEAYQQDFFGV